MQIANSRASPLRHLLTMVGQFLRNGGLSVLSLFEFLCEHARCRRGSRATRLSLAERVLARRGRHLLALVQAGHKSIAVGVSHSPALELVM